MDDWFRWIAATAVGVITLVFGGITRRLFTLIDAKAGRESTNDRFDQVLNRLDKHMGECREDKRDLYAKLDKMQTDISATKENVAVLAAKQPRAGGA